MNDKERIAFLEARHQELLERNNELVKQRRQVEKRLHDLLVVVKALVFDYSTQEED